MKKLMTSLLFLSLIVVSCSREKEGAMTELPPVAVIVEQARGSVAPKQVGASGTIKAEKSANISTRMMGHVNTVKVRTGDRVAQGALLLTLGSADLQAKGAQAAAAVVSAQAAHKNAKRDYDRFAALFAQNSASQKEMDEVVTQYEMAKAGLEAALQMENEVKAQFSYTNIRAPFSGTVTGTFVKEGDMANPGSPLVSVEDGSRFQAEALVSESEIHLIKTGTRADIHIKSLDLTIPGEVVEVSTSARNTGGQYLVTIDLDPTEKVLAGMFVHVVFPIGEEESDSRETVFVPREAVIRQGQLKGIYVLDPGNRAILRWLRLGRTQGGTVEVLSGLALGETYVVSSEGRLFNGAKVQVQLK